MSSALSYTPHYDAVCTSQDEIRSAGADGNAANWSAVLAARRTAKSTCFFQPTLDESKILQSWLRENLAAKPWSLLVEEVTGKPMPRDRLGASASGQAPAQPTRIGVYPYSSETDSRVWKLSMPQSAVSSGPSLPTKPGPAGDWDSMCSTAAPADGAAASYRSRAGGAAPLAARESQKSASSPVSGTLRARMSSTCAIAPQQGPAGNAIGEADPLDPTDSGFDHRERDNEQSGSENDSTDSSSGGGVARGARRIDSSQVGVRSTSIQRGESPLGMESGSSAASVYRHGAAGSASNKADSLRVSHASGNSTGAGQPAGCQQAAGGAHASAVLEDLRGPGVKFQAIGVTGQRSAGMSGTAAAAAASSVGAPPAIAEPNEACWLRLRRTWAHRAAVRQAHAFGRCMSDSCRAAKQTAFQEGREAAYSPMQYIRLPDAYTTSRPSELKLTIGRARYGHEPVGTQAGEVQRRARVKAAHASSSPRRRPVPRRHSHGHGNGRAMSHDQAVHAYAGAGGCPTLPMYRPVRRVTFMVSDAEAQEHAAGPASAESNGSSPAGSRASASASAATMEGSSPMEGYSGRTRTCSWKYGQGQATDPSSASVCLRNRRPAKPAKSSTGRTRWTSSGSSSTVKGGAALQDVKERSSEWSRMKANEATAKGGKDSITVSPLFMLNGLSVDQVALLEGGMALMEEVLGLSGLVLVVPQFTPA